MPNARLLEANSLVELRLQPERLTGEIAAFLEEVLGAAARGGGQRAGATQRARPRKAARRRAASRRDARAQAARAQPDAGNSSISSTFTCPGAVGVPTAERAPC